MKLRSQLSSTTNIHFSPFCLYFCIVLGMVSSPDPSLATLICPPSSFTAVMSVFSEMLLRWPLYWCRVSGVFSRVTSTWGASD